MGVDIYSNWQVLNWAGSETAVTDKTVVVIQPVMGLKRKNDLHVLVSSCRLLVAELAPYGGIVKRGNVFLLHDIKDIRLLGHSVVREIPGLCNNPRDAWKFLLRWKLSELLSRRDPWVDLKRRAKKLLRKNQQLPRPPDGRLPKRHVVTSVPRSQEKVGNQNNHHDNLSAPPAKGADRLRAAYSAVPPPTVYDNSHIEPICKILRRRGYIWPILKSDLSLAKALMLEAARQDNIELTDGQIVDFIEKTMDRFGYQSWESMASDEDVRKYKSTYLPKNSRAPPPTQKEDAFKGICISLALVFIALATINCSPLTALAKVYAHVVLTLSVWLISRLVTLAGIGRLLRSLIS